MTAGFREDIGSLISLHIQIDPSDASDFLNGILIAVFVLC